MNRHLATARAYWRLARKAERAKKRTTAALYRNLAGQAFRRYERERDFHQRSQGGQ